MDSNVATGAERKAMQATRMRQALSTTLQDVESSQNARAPADATNAMVASFIEFEAITREERERLLQNSNASTAEDLMLAEWYASRYDQLARMARSITERPLAARTADAAPSWAYSILLRGHATKWRQVAGHRAIAPRGVLHQVFKSAIAAGIGDGIMPMIIEGQPLETTIEALYARTLLLERFASGNLTAQRLEILDNWLVSWMGAMWLSRDASTAGDGPLLCVDTNSETHGLMRVSAGSSADYFMALRPLERQLARAVQSFHRGVIFPGWGIGMAFRIDEHVAVIEHLEQEFRLLSSGAETKSKRSPVARGAEVDFFAGIEDVSAVCAGKTVRGQRLRLLDVSQSGIGLSSPVDAALNISIEDLVAVRLEPRGGLLLGEVVRKATGAERNTVVVGVRLLSKEPLQISVSMSTPHAGPVMFDALFIRGDSDAGNGDAIVLSDAAYRFDVDLHANIRAAHFVLRPGRVRRHGRGWKLVSFDVASVQ
jgi:hypothetical protein